MGILEEKRGLRLSCPTGKFFVRNSRSHSGTWEIWGREREKWEFWQEKYGFSGENGNSGRKE